MSTCRVYARCWAGRRRYLQVMHVGTRKACQKYVQHKQMAGQPTHCLEVSSREITAATKKLCDGARFDPVACCCYD